MKEREVGCASWHLAVNRLLLEVKSNLDQVFPDETHQNEVVVGAVIPMVPTPTAWTVDDEGDVHFMLTSNGFTREQWEYHLRGCGCQIGDHARQVLSRASEAPTSGVTYNIVVRPGEKWSDEDRTTKNIRAVAEKYGWAKPHWEVACLIRITFTDDQLEQMGLQYIMIMHEPINGPNDIPSLLGSPRDDGRLFRAYHERPDVHFNDRGGFAFTVPQILPS